MVTASSNPSLLDVGDELLHYVEDNGPPGELDASVTETEGVTAASCASSEPDHPLQEVQTGNWVVKDRD